MMADDMISETKLSYDEFLKAKVRLAESDGFDVDDSVGKEPDMILIGHAVTFRTVSSVGGGSFGSEVGE